MTASNHCCECKNPTTHRLSLNHCGNCKLPVKETPAAVDANKRMGELHDKIRERTYFESAGAPLGITPSPRLDWCGACEAEHGYDCPKDKPQPSKEWWEDDLRGRFLHTQKKEDALISFIRRIAAQSEKKVIEQFFEIEKNKWKDAQHCTCLGYALIEVSGGEDSAEGQKMQERLLESARSSEEGKTNNK